MSPVVAKLLTCAMQVCFAVRNDKGFFKVKKFMLVMSRDITLIAANIWLISNFMWRKPRKMVKSRDCIMRDGSAELFNLISFIDSILEYSVQSVSESDKGYCEPAQERLFRLLKRKALS